MGRGKALNAPPLLVDENRRVRPPDAPSQCAGERADLIRRSNVAAEENEAPGLDFAKERRLVRPQLGTGATEDGGKGQRTKQVLPAAFSRSQRAWASSREPKPVIAVR